MTGLSRAAFLDGWNRAHGEPAKTFDRLLDDADLEAWSDGWMAGLQDRRRARAAAAAEADAQTLEAARIAAGEYLKQHPSMNRHADDILSDACAGAAAAAARWSPEGGSDRWNYVIRRARGAVADGVRQRAATTGVTRAEFARGLLLADLPAHRQPVESIEWMAEASGVHPAYPSDFTEQVGHRHIAASLLADCTERERQVLIATLVQGYSLAEVAARLGCSETWAYRIRRTCLERLRQQHVEAVAL